MKNAKILIVEDERIVAKDIENCLKELGYIVSATIASGRGAIQKVEETRPDLVLMDIHLRGDMDGTEAAQHIRDNFNIPIVYLTAYSDEKTFERAKITEPFGYVLKPFDERELYTAIEIALSRHKAELAILKALEKEKEMLDLKSRFVSMVSHEITNPLNIISATTELLQDPPQPLTDTQRQEQLRRIQASTEQIAEILSAIHNMSQGELTTLKFKAQPLVLENFCRDQIDALRAGEGRRHQLHFKSQGNCESARMDERLLWHILTNLLSNAVKYSPQGSTIDFNLECEPETAIFRIEDRGIGIPPEAQPYLFESFYRATNADNIPGSGLGLTIVKRCVDLHNGQIGFNSQVGAGTTFTVKLPIQS